jgi:hypothetical protein
MAKRESVSGFTFPQKGNVIYGTSRTGRNVSTPFRILKGVDTYIQFSIQEAVGKAKKLYNKTLKATVVKSKSNDIILTRNLKIENYDLGIASLTILSTDTIAKDAGYYDLILTITEENSNTYPVYVDSTYKTDYSLEILENYVDTTPNLFEVTSFTTINDIEYSDKLLSTSQVANTFGNLTVVFYATDFTGSVGIEASLASNPNENDWFSVDLTLVNPKKTYENFTGIDAYAFEGKFMWVRFSKETVSGIIDKILYIV